jgi:hypothetical protein
MSKPTPNPTFKSNPLEPLQLFVESVCKTAVWVGTAGLVIGLGFLMYTFSVVGSGASAVDPGQVQANISLFSKVLLGGSLVLTLSLTYLYWGEETLGVLQLIGAGALYFAPLILPSMFGVQVPSQAGSEALGAIQTAGLFNGAIAIVVLVADLLVRVRLRSKQGMKADALKYGKGMTEEREIQNVFMGKCWQLPFCRKFVRERCPIYHSRRTCWKEQVGCMCEEQVIRDAMEGKVIPKDAVMAATYIPRNNKLTTAQKHERCRQCVIYNEHQKHKYKLLLPAVGLSFAGLYILLREPLLGSMKVLIEGLDRMIGRATFRGPEVGVRETISTSGLPFQEILLICFVIVAFAYALRLVEFLVFKLKV